MVAQPRHPDYPTMTQGELSSHCAAAAPPASSVASAASHAIASTLGAAASSLAAVSHDVFHMHQPTGAHDKPEQQSRADGLASADVTITSASSDAPMGLDVSVPASGRMDEPLTPLPRELSAVRESASDSRCSSSVAMGRASSSTGGERV